MQDRAQVIGTVTCRWKWDICVLRTSASQAWRAVCIRACAPPQDKSGPTFGCNQQHGTRSAHEGQYGLRSCCRGAGGVLRVKALCCTDGCRSLKDVLKRQEAHRRAAVAKLDDVAERHAQQQASLQHSSNDSLKDKHVCWMVSRVNSMSTGLIRGPPTHSGGLCVALICVRNLC